MECPRAISRAWGAVGGVLLGAFSHNTNDLNDVRIKRRRVFWKGGTTSISSPVLHSSGGYFAAFLPQWSAFLKVQFIPDTFIILWLFCSNFLGSPVAPFLSWHGPFLYRRQVNCSIIFLGLSLDAFRWNTRKRKIAKLNFRWKKLPIDAPARRRILMVSISWSRMQILRW